MRFEWDIKKDEINFLKHKVRFERARNVQKDMIILIQKEKIGGM